MDFPGQLGAPHPRVGAGHILEQPIFPKLQKEARGVGAGLGSSGLQWLSRQLQPQSCSLKLPL